MRLGLGLGVRSYTQTSVFALGASFAWSPPTAGINTRFDDVTSDGLLAARGSDQIDSVSPTLTQSGPGNYWEELSPGVLRGARDSSNNGNATYSIPPGRYELSFDLSAYDGVAASPSLIGVRLSDNFSPFFSPTTPGSYTQQADIASGDLVIFGFANDYGFRIDNLTIRKVFATEGADVRLVDVQSWWPTSGDRLIMWTLGDPYATAGANRPVIDFNGTLGAISCSVTTTGDLISDVTDDTGTSLSLSAVTGDPIQTGEVGYGFVRQVSGQVNMGSVIDGVVANASTTAGALPSDITEAIFGDDNFGANPIEDSSSRFAVISGTFDTDQKLIDATNTLGSP